MEHLKQTGIGTGIHYPIPLHLQKAYAGLNYRKGDFPVAEKVAAEIVSLPMFPQLTNEQQARVANELRAFFDRVEAFLLSRFEGTASSLRLSQTQVTE
jgi:dTDP-4-amino-4,6-dideoxygalactose transaminase